MIGYIPILILILPKCEANQVLVVPNSEGFSIPRCEPEPEP